MTAMRSSHRPDRLRLLLFAGFAIVTIAGFLAFSGPIKLAGSYHHFHDDRTIFGIPSFWNVVSNLPFLLVGWLGLTWLSRKPRTLDAQAIPPYTVLFAGLTATAFGSAYYHLAPNDMSLFWDRMPIAVAFMGLFTALLTERIDRRAAALLAPLVLYGAASVLWWDWLDDLRPYVIAQFFPLLAIPVLLALFPPRWSRGGDLMLAAGCYVAAKVLEIADGRVLEATGLVSGHTMKHLAAAMGAYLVYRMLVKRERIAAA